MKLTAKNSGYYIVSINGVDVSKHTAEREAIESAANYERANPVNVVQYRHEYVVDVEEPIPAPDPIPDPVSEDVLIDIPVLFEFPASSPCDIVLLGELYPSPVSPY